MRLLAIIYVVLFCCIHSFAQGKSSFSQYRRQKQKEFTDYKARRYSEFEEYRKRKNHEFAVYVKQRWQSFETYKGIAIPRQFKPVDPVICHPDMLPISPVEIPKGDVVSLKMPDVVAPIVIPLAPESDVKHGVCVDFMFFGRKCKVEFDSGELLVMSNIGEEEVSRLITMLSSNVYSGIAAECSSIQQDMRLNGWATYKLCQKIASSMGCGKNESVVITTFLMNQLGYDVRISRTNDNLMLLSTVSMDLCKYYYINLNDRKYYVLDDDYHGESVYTYPVNMKDAVRALDFDNAVRMNLGYKPSEQKVFMSAQYPMAKAEICVNEYLMEYYSTEPYFADFPWAFYARQSLDSRVEAQLLPHLKSAIAGMSETEAVTVLMSFMQYGFQYATDDEQFGYEKPFFLEENFYYPANDCEDRAILLSYLVRNLVGLDVVLLYYPGHLWTAVCFDSAVSGDYIVLGNKRYTICDPTYIGAPVGMTQPAYRGKTPNVIKIY